MLRGTSAYFDTGKSTFMYNADVKCFQLVVSCSFKHYDNEIDDFLDWLQPYVDAEAGAVIGSRQYEEDRYPTNIIKQVNHTGLA